ncbi:MAG: FHA domain-containing protein [Pseudomonadota bacterium]|nr:FHA domain-containing protein [Pseudomonadota bacterium]
MAVLLVQERLIALGARTLFGRTALCNVCVDDRQVSGEHASIRWSEGAWQVRDLGSRNGTFLDDVQLEPGMSRVLTVGATLRLGAQFVARVLDVGPPGPSASREGDARLAHAMDGLLVLPGAEDPRALVFEEAGGAWTIEIDGDPTPAQDGQTIALGAETWRILLPIGPRTEGVPPTWDVAAKPQIESLALTFRPSADEEQVDILLGWPGGLAPLSPRTHQFVMLQLARARQQDHDAGVSRGEAGWRYTDELQRAMRLEPATLNLYLFRAREQLAQAGVDGAARLFERRRLSGQIRLGVEKVTVLPPG